jgi:mono/diheme cytochrome c family protein
MAFAALLYHCKAARSVAHCARSVALMPSPDNISMPQPRRIPLGILLATLAVLLALAMVSGCDVERRKSDAELGLNPQQSAGRKLYDSHCDRCHEPYSTRGKKGPGLKGVFQNKYLSLSGLPANDERVSDIVRLGRNEMPGYSQTLSSQDLQDLLAYLHTL